MLLQGYKEDDFVARTTHQITSWQHTITTLVKLSEPQPEPTEDEIVSLVDRLRAK